MNLNKKTNNKGQALVITLISMLAIIVILLFASLSVIRDGEVGVYTLFGDIRDTEYEQGVYLFNPFATITKYNIKQMTITENSVVPSSDGLSVDVDSSVIFSVKPNRASEIRQYITGDIVDTKLVPYIRGSLRDITAGYEASQIYSQTGREEIADKLRLQLEEDIGEDLIIVDVMLREVILPKSVSDAIERKLDQQQKAQAKEFELDSAKKDAQIEIERAKGIAEANDIIADSISNEYIKYMFVKGLNDGHTETIYVPTEANIPILEVKP